MCDQRSMEQSFEAILKFTDEFFINGFRGTPQFCHVQSFPNWQVAEVYSADTRLVNSQQYSFSSWVSIFFTCTCNNFGAVLCTHLSGRSATFLRIHMLSFSVFILASVLSRSLKSEPTVRCSLHPMFAIYKSTVYII